MDPRGRRILVFGDSLTHRGARTAPDGVPALPLANRTGTPGDLLASYLLTAGAAAVRVNGRVSRSAINLWKGNNGENGAAVVAAEAGARPDLVIIMLGTNDLGMGAAADAAAFQRLRDAFAGYGAEVVAIGPPAFARADLNAKAVTVYQTLARVFGANDVIDARPLSADVVTTAQGRAGDGIHFAGSGASKVAARLAQAVLARPGRVAAGGAADAGIPSAGGGTAVVTSTPSPWWAVVGATLAVAAVGGAVLVKRRRAVRLAGAPRVVPAVEARDYVRAIRRGDARSKRGGRDFTESVDPGPLLELDVPLAEIGLATRAWLTESTDPTRVAAYTKAEISTPVYLVRARRGLTVSDGVHRVLAALARGDTTIRALVPYDYAAARGWTSTPSTLGAVTVDVDDVPARYRGEVAAAATRAGSAGADGPLEFIGMGMEGVVFCDGADRAYKVGRRLVTGAPPQLATEAAFLKKAGQIPAIKQHVAKFYRYDAASDVIVRECVRPKGTRRGGRNLPSDDDAWDMGDRIGKVMRPYGFTAPERKPDSFVHVSGRGLVLVDAGFALKRGHELVKEALDVANERRPVTKRRAQDLVWALAAERGDSIPAKVADPLITRLRAQTPGLDGVTKVTSQPWLDVDDDMEVAEWRVTDEADIDGVELRNNMDPTKTVLAHRSTKQRGWQATWFDDRGPAGDVIRPTLVAALEDQAPASAYDVVAVHLRSQRGLRGGGGAVVRQPLVERPAVRRALVQLERLGWELQVADLDLVTKRARLVAKRFDGRLVTLDVQNGQTTVVRETEEHGTKLVGRRGDRMPVPTVTMRLLGRDRIPGGPQAGLRFLADYLDDNRLYAAPQLGPKAARTAISAILGEAHRDAAIIEDQQRQVRDQRLLTES
jgi:lysophospholipase L1-like esterase